MRIAPKAPILCPNKPEKIAPIKGKLIIKRYMVFYLTNFLHVLAFEWVLCPRTGNL